MNEILKIPNQHAKITGTIEPETPRNDFSGVIILLGAWLGICIAALCFNGCKSPYPPCGEAATYRCAGSMVEMCDGQNWNPRWDCGEIYFDGDNPVIYQCVEREAKATCEVIK